MYGMIVKSRRFRRNVLVSASPGRDLFEEPTALILRPLEGSGVLPAEYDPLEKTVRFVLDEIDEQRPRAFRVERASVAGLPEAVATGGAVVLVDTERVDLRLRGKLLLSYNSGCGFPKPFINPLNGPFDIPLLREVQTPESTADHPWQRGITFMHGAVNEVDCWNEPLDQPHGRTRQDWVSSEQSAVSAAVLTGNTWFDPAGSPLLRDTRCVRAYSLPDWPAIVDFRLTIQSANQTVELKPTKEAGFLALRLDPRLAGRAGGSIENCYGARGEKECWGRPAQWVDYSAKVAGRQVGIALFDHPENPGYPARWHVRDYGLFAPNSWLGAKPRSLPPGETLTFRWRMIVHEGDAAQADIRNLFLDYEPGFPIDVEPDRRE